MAYATAEDFRSSLGDSQYKAIYKGDDSLAEHDLLLASAEIDGYLAKRYTVPVTSAGAADLLRDFAIGLAAPKAYFRQASGDLPENQTARRGDPENPPGFFHRRSPSRRGRRSAAERTVGPAGDRLR